MVAVFAGWAGPTGLPWWETLGLEPSEWWHLITLTAMGGAMMCKVERPTLALVMGGVCVAADLSFGLSLGVLICLTDLIYNHGIRAPAHRVKVAERILSVSVLALVVVAAVFDTPRAALNMLLLGTAILMVPLWWATEVRRGYPAFVEDQVRRHLEEERHSELLAQQKRSRTSAVEAERRHMARELHDVVSSQVASIALTSAAVLNSAPDSVRDRNALSTIRVTSVNAMEELRHMVQVLRNQNGGEDDDTSAELLTDTSWEQVVGQARRQGLEVDLQGEPPEDFGPAVQAVLLRILHESLTNALRHGTGPALVRQVSC